MTRRVIKRFDELFLSLYLLITFIQPITRGRCYQVHEYTMCKGVDDQTGNPLDVGTNFKTTDTVAVLWVNLTDVHTIHIIRYEWYDPDGRLYHTFDYHTESPGEGQHFPWYMIYGTVLIKGYLPEYMYGTWRVKFYIDNEPTGSTTFQILNEFEETPPLNNDPVADINGPYTSVVGESISFSSSGSYDMDGEIGKYEWDFGDGSEPTSEKNPDYTYMEAGTYSVTLTVTDNMGAQDTISKSCTVTSRPSMTLSIEKIATLIPIIGALAGVVGWMARTRSEQRRRIVLFRELMQGVDEVYTRYKMNARTCEAELFRFKDQIIDEFKQSMITEENYNILVSRIEEYLREIKEEFENGRLRELRGKLDDKLRHMIEEGGVTEEGFKELEQLVNDEIGLTEGEKAEMREFLERCRQEHLKV